MKRALAVVVVPLLALACGGASEPPQTAADATPAADAPAADAPAADGAGDKPASDKPGGKSDDEGSWSGEAEAKADKGPADGGGQAETRTMDVIAKMVKENRQPVRDCMDKAKKQLPDLKGNMIINFVIDPEGKVKKAELNIERSTLKNPDVAECAVKTITGIKFPPSSRGMDTTVNYPYNLN